MLEPLLFRILVKKFELEETDETYKKAKEFGFVIPDNEARKRDNNAVDKGKVIAIGPDAFKEWTSEQVVRVGDEVYFAKYAGKVLKDPYTGEEFLALNDEDLVARITK